MTARCRHAEAKADPAVLAATCYFRGNQIIESISCRLALWNCHACHSTIAVPMPGHVDDDWEPPTAVTDVSTLNCHREQVEPVEQRAGFVAPAEVAA